MQAWPHQEYAVREYLAARALGWRRVLITSPTGGGKTFVMARIIRHHLERAENVLLYTNRRWLLEQTSGVMNRYGLQHGLRAAGHCPDEGQLFQVSSIQTEHSRVVKRGSWELFQANTVLIDEAHLQKGATVKQLLDAHVQEGAYCVGLTATPLGLGGLYDHLIVAGTPSELRRCGALVSAVHYGPDEPDLRHVGRVQLGEDLSEAQNVKAIMVPGIFGRVLEWYKRLNPQGRPAVLFAPGVGESLWFAEQLVANGITAAHIDGAEVWLNGRTHRTSQEAREEVRLLSRKGEVKVVCNRFVMREGLDWPWLEHGILATVFGSLQSYLQAGGRLLRACAGKERAVIQDHGGNYHRHGSLNADREWHLGDTAAEVAALRQDRLRGKKCRRCGAGLNAPWPVCPSCGLLNETEPVRCPECSRVLQGWKCPCGWEARGSAKSRPVAQADGSLKHMTGDVYRPRRLTKKKNAARIWERVYYRAKSKKWDATFRQAEAMFARENNWGWPPRDLPLMPRDEGDWGRKVSEVPYERLIPKPEEQDHGKDQDEGAA